MLIYSEPEWAWSLQMRLRLNRSLDETGEHNQLSTPCGAGAAKRAKGRI